MWHFPPMNHSKMRVFCVGLCIRRYCKDKITTPVLKNAELAELKLKETEKSADSVINCSEEYIKIKARALKQVSAEKEQDANMRSRLSKECKSSLFVGSKLVSSRHHIVIRLDEINAKDTSDWSTYNFDQVDITNTMFADNITVPSCPKEGVRVEDSKNVHSNTEGGGGEFRGKENALRPIRQEPGKVLFAFVPEEWWRAFFSKTGVTGFGTFLFSFGTFLISKEYYVLEHYYYHGLSAFILWVLAIKYIGPKLKQFLDREVDEYEKAWNEGRVQQKNALNESILNELRLQWESEGELLVIEAKRENVHLQLEEEFRNRQMQVYKEVKNRLDYHVEVERAKERIKHKNLIHYVTTQVEKSITPEMQDKLIYYSIDRIIEDLDKVKPK